MLSPDTQPPVSTTEPPPRETAVAPSAFLNPYFQVALSILLSAAAQVLLKLGANETVHEIWLGVSGLKSGWVWLGIVAMVTSLVSWLYALRFIPLNIAFNLAGFIHVLVPVSCWIFLGEKISATRWVGILLVVTGVLVIAKPLMKVEERL